MSRHTVRGRMSAALLAGLMLVALVPAAATAAPSATGCASRTNNTYAKLLECVRTEGVLEHLQAFQEIADANGGNRAAGLPGYQASVDYVVEQLQGLGYQITLDPFDFTYAEGSLRQLTPVAAEYDSGPFTGTGNGDVTGTIVPVDLALAPPRASTSGCEAADFAGLDFSGTADIALIQRGTCNFSTKALNAEAAGAEGVIIFNQGNHPTREGLITGTLGGSNVVDIPVVGASFAQGQALAQSGATARIVAIVEERTDVNVLAELPGRNRDNVVMAGAHLDSVQRGPGVNDNGSGSAGILEVAQNIAKLRPENTVRFAWWGAEESGLIGSREYVAELSQAEKDRIALYLNFDMIGSPNYILGVYDGDESTFPAPTGVPIPEGSIQIEDVFESFYTEQGVPYEDSQFSGRSDYQAFINDGIPAGGLFTGAEVVKTAEQAAIWGGTAGAQFDPCYHQACDTIDNLSLEALDVNSDAIAYAVLTYAYSTESVNGVRGKAVPSAKPMATPAGPEGTYAPGGGGLDPDHHGHDHDHEGEPA